MPNLGFPEIMIILVVALLVFGPKKLPDLGRSLGNGIREFRKGTQGLKDELEGNLKDGRPEPQATQAVAVPAAAATILAPASPVLVGEGPATSAMPSAPVRQVIDLGKPAAREDSHQA